MILGRHLYLILCVLCVAVCGLEVELKTATQACCSSKCSIEQLENVHNLLGLYKRTPNPDQETVSYATEVLAGKRCAKQSRSVPQTTTNAGSVTTGSRPTSAGSVTTGSIPTNAGSVTTGSRPTNSTTGSVTTSGGASSTSSRAVTSGNASSNSSTSSATTAWNPTSANSGAATTASGSTSRATTANVYNSTTGFATSTTTGSTTGNTVSVVVLQCPQTVELGSYFTCFVDIYNPVGDYSVLYFASPPLPCATDNDCYQYLQNTSFIASISATFYANQVGLFNFQATYDTYTFSNSASVTVIAEFNEVDINDLQAPTALYSNMNSIASLEFLVSFSITSKVELQHVYVYYVPTDLNNPTFGWASYYLPPRDYTLYFDIDSYQHVAPGTYCLQIEIEDVLGNYMYLNESCLEVSEVSCGAGNYLSVSNGVSCTPCPIGFYNPTSNSLQCYACPPGLTSSCSMGAKSCVPCDPGTSSSNGICQQCTPGTFSSYSGFTGECAPCPAGSYASDYGASYCLYCNSGFYSEGGADACTICPAGTFSTPGSSTCIKCSSGFYSFPGSYYCSECPTNTYSSTGSAQCTRCPAGKISPSGSYTCFAAK